MNERKACCQQTENLEVIEDRPGVVLVHRCTVCGCRHFRAFMAEKLQPGKVSLGGH